MAKMTNLNVALRSENPTILENYIKKIWLVDNDKIPFTSAVGVQSAPAGDRSLEWFNDSLPTIDATQKAPPGDVLSITATVNPTAVRNHMQIFATGFTVDRMADKTAAVGKAGTFAYTLSLRMKSQKLSIERRGLSGYGSVKPADGTAGEFASAGSMITANVNVAKAYGGPTGGNAADRAGFDGNNWLPAPIPTRTGVTTRTLTEEHVLDVFKKIFDASGNSSSLCIFASSGNTQKIASTFKGRASTVESAATEATATNYVDAYKTPFGDLVPIKTAAQCPDYHALIIDKSETYFSAMRQFETIKDDTSINDGISGSLRSELTLVLGNNKSHGKVADLKL